MDGRLSILRRVNPHTPVRRAGAQAETERDAMATRLAQRGEAADAALAEAHAMGERRRNEAESVRAHAAESHRRVRDELEKVPHTGSKSGPACSVLLC